MDVRKLTSASAAWPVHHPLLTLFAVILLCLLAAIRLVHVAPDANIDAMFPEDSPASAAILRIMRSFGAAEEMLLLLSLPPHASAPPDVSPLLAYADRLDHAIASSPEASQLCDGIIYKADAQMRGFFEKHLVPAGLFYLTDDQLQQARQRLSPQGIQDQIAQNQVMVLAPGPAASAIAKLTLQDPLRLHQFLMDRLLAARPFQTYQNSEHFLSPDGNSLLIRVKGRRPPSDIDYAKHLTRVIQDLALKLNTDHLTLDFAGSYPIATASEKAIRADLVNSITCSVIFLQLLFLLAYRKPLRLFALAFLPVAIGVLLGFGANTFFQSTITPMTAAIGTVLAGLAIDYSVYLISDYEAQRQLRLPPRDAALRTLTTVTPALVAAYATTLVGFLAIGWSSVPGIRDFARIGALGLTGAFLTAVGLLPALLALFDRRTHITPASPSRMRFSTFPLLLWISRHRRISLTFSAVLLLLSIAILLHSPDGWLPLEQNLAVMHPQPNPSLDAQSKIARAFGTSPDALLIHLSAQTPDQLLSLSHDARQRLALPLIKRHAGITGTFSLADLLPDPRAIPARLAALTQVDPDKVVSDFQSAIAQSSFDPAAYAPYAQFLRTLLTPTRAPDLSDLLQFPSLARSLLPSSALRENRPPTQALMLVFVDNTLDHQDQRTAAVQTIRAALADLPGATLTGLSVIGYDTQQVVHHDLPRMLSIASAIVGLYLLLFFRNLKAAILATLPMLAGILLLLAAASLIDCRLNMVNLIAAPLLIGVDVDYGVFLVSLASTQTRPTRHDLARRLDSGLYAVFVCLGSALLGFGTLYFTSVPAVQSLGFAVAVGLAASLLFTLFFRLPLLFAAAPDHDPSSPLEPHYPTTI